MQVLGNLDQQFFGALIRPDSDFRHFTSDEVWLLVSLEKLLDHFLIITAKFTHYPYDLSCHLEIKKDILQIQT